MKTFARGARTVLVVMVLGVGFAACGGKVIIDGPPRHLTGGSGGGGGGGAVASSTSTGDTGVGGSGGSGSGSAGCGDASCSMYDGVNCTCSRDCGTSTRRINCVLTDTLTQKNVIQCVCSYDDVFSGVCYEKNKLACDFDKGCCAKYFSGI